MLNQMPDSTGTFELDPKKIVVRDDLPRIRTDLGDIKRILESMNKFGQLQPIVINRAFELIAGGRRLAACLLGNRQARVIFNDAVDPLEMREMELEENVQRKALTPSEELLAIKEIHTLKVSKYGESGHGPNNEGWKIQDTADLLGRTRGSISQDLALATFIEKFPELKECKTKSEINKASKGISKVIERSKALEQFEKVKVSMSRLCTVVNDDARSHMKTIEDNSVDLLLTDPPYGIEINEIMMTAGGTTGGFSTTGFMYDDSKENAMSLYLDLARESARFCKDTAHAWVFVGPEWFWIVREMFVENGWQVYIKPIIWIKGQSGQSNYPSYWPASTYEMILFARRSNAHLIIEGRPDHIQCPIVNPSERLHQAEKPVDLLKELITRTALPGQKMYDPFCGAGSSIAAGLFMKLIPTGCELAHEAYTATLQRLNDIKEKVL